MKLFLSIFTLVSLSWVNQCAAQLQFNYNSVGNTFADGGLELATNLWAQEFKDDITVNLNFSFSNLGAGALSSAASATQTNTYVDFWSAIGNDATSSDDTTMWNGLPTGQTFSVYINHTSEAGFSNTPYVDDDGGANNANVRITTANAKALGLRSANDTVTDAAIIFNDSFAWDFDPTDGITEGTLDFVGIATHEIGHALGFESGVDELDANGFGAHDDNALPFVSSIDFLRFSTDSETFGADIDWTADKRGKYYSIDGGLSVALPGAEHWSTGVVYGDGEQASHWKDGVGIGIMDPTTSTGTASTISGIDLQAFDVIGYDRSFVSAVPEPTSLSVVSLGLAAFLLRRRRRLALLPRS
ncbi:MAG: NF038122 family metalloprotease [Mariniblastus sp.]|nr:NF038122 family metalloprotease [Mariniblastus sp.]